MKHSTPLLITFVGFFAPLATHAAEAWRTLFNGKDLSAWKAAPIAR